MGDMFFNWTSPCIQVLLARAPLHSSFVMIGIFAKVIEDRVGVFRCTSFTVRLRASLGWNYVQQRFAPRTTNGSKNCESQLNQERSGFFDIRQRPFCQYSRQRLWFRSATLCSVSLFLSLEQKLEWWRITKAVKKDIADAGSLIEKSIGCRLKYLDHVASSEEPISSYVADSVSELRVVSEDYDSDISVLEVACR